MGKKKKNDGVWSKLDSDWRKELERSAAKRPQSETRISQRWTQDWRLACGSEWDGVVRKGGREKGRVDGEEKQRARTAAATEKAAVAGGG